MAAGVYLLLIKVKPCKIRVGSLGKLSFGGFYCYVGSAPSFARIKRHMRRKKKRFWHIDYLLSKGKVVKVFWKKARREEECKLAKILAENFEAVEGFGSSDCNCISHLFKVEKARLEKIVKKEKMEELAKVRFKLCRATLLLKESEQSNQKAKAL